MTREPVLVVEDNAMNRKLVRTILELDGFDVRVAESGERALEVLADFRPAIVLCDIQMAGMDGIELARRLREDPTLAEVPVVAVTAYAMRGDRERFLAQGFDGYISKPIDPATFSSVVRGFVERRRTPDG